MAPARYRSRKFGERRFVQQAHLKARLQDAVVLVERAGHVAQARDPGTTSVGAEGIYGIPAKQVVGSRIKTNFEMGDGKPVLVRLPEPNFDDDKDGKPVGINQHVGRRPIMAFGNSKRRWKRRP